MRSRGFTLLELLVGVALAAGLLAVAAGAVARSRDAGARAACKSNLHQLATAATAYAADHDGRYPPAAEDMGSGNSLRWHGKKAGGVFRPEGGALSEYLGGATAQVRRCPGAPETEDGFESGCGGYGYNMAGIGSCSAHPEAAVDGDVYATGLPVALVTNPAGIVMFADTAYAAGSAKKPKLIEYSFCEPASWSGGGEPWPTIHFRHGGKACVAWCDGHVTEEVLARTGARGAQQKLGWFAPADNSVFIP